MNLADGTVLTDESTWAEKVAVLRLPLDEIEGLCLQPGASLQTRQVPKRQPRRGAGGQHIGDVYQHAGHASRELSIRQPWTPVKYTRKNTDSSGPKPSRKVWLMP